MRSTRGHSRSEFGDVEPVWARDRCRMSSGGGLGSDLGRGNVRKTRMRFFERCHRPPAGDTMRSTRGQSTSGGLSRRCSGGGSHKLGMGPLWGMEGAGGAVGGSGAHPGCRRSKLPFWDGARGVTVAVWRCGAGLGAGQMSHEVCWGMASDWGRKKVRKRRMRFFKQVSRAFGARDGWWRGRTGGVGVERV